MKVRKLVKEFLSHAERNRKPSTCRHYRGRLKKFAKMYGHKRLEKISPKRIDRYLRKANYWKNGDEKAQDTRRANIIVIQTMFRWAQRMRFLKKLPFDVIEKPPSRRRDRIPTPAEDAAIEAQASPAFLAIFTALKWTAARPGELVKAQISDYHPKRRMIVLKDHKTASKTNRPRLIGISRKLEPLVLQAIGGRTEGHIFLDDAGLPWTVQKLSRRYSEYRDKAGLDKGLVLYCQRHSLATKITREKGPHVAQQILGHTNISTTVNQYHPPEEDIVNNLDALE